MVQVVNACAAFGQKERWFTAKERYQKRPNGRWKETAAVIVTRNHCVGEPFM